MKINQVLCLVLMLVAGGCGGQRSFLKKVKQGTIQELQPTYRIDRDGIDIAACVLNSTESYKYFGVDMKSKGYIAILLQIENLSPDIYVLRPNYISVPLTSADIIAKLLHYDTSLFVTSMGALSLLFFWPATIIVGQTGYDMYRSNKTMNELIADCVYEHQIVEILPYERFSKFIFVARDEYNGEFDMKLYNRDLKKISKFYIPLNN